MSEQLILQSKTPLIGLTGAELSERVQEWGLPAYRGKQIAQWLYKKGALDFEQMTDLSKETRLALAEKAQVGVTSVALNKHSRDGVDKLLIKMADEQIIESVLLPYPDRVSCCISTQVGCPMGCTFCATAQGGFLRNLSAGEIVEQVLTLQRFSERRISHVVYMGMGEPLLNFENVIKSARIFNDEIGIGMRHLTISTVGLVPKIRELGKKKLQLNLAISLHAADDETRARLMPVNNRWPLAELFAACREYVEQTGRKMTFEYLLISEVNDTPEQAKKLSKWVKGLPCVINLIPFNYVETPQGFKRPSNERIKAFRAELESYGLNVTQRVERGHDIEGACGQLRGKHQGRLGNRNLIAPSAR